MADKKWNEQQLQAINSFGGNLLVSAAAGSGKTAVLVERVAKMLTDEQNPVDADLLLIVTFTNLAAAEMKARINAKLSSLASQNPQDARLQRQLLLMERAHIGTIHSFCLDIIRENFSVIGLAPDCRIADEDEASDIASAALEETIEKYYAEGSAVFAELAETLGGGRNDSGLGESVLTLYNFIRALPHYDDWLCEKAAMYNPAVPIEETAWGEILLDRARSVLERGKENIEYAIAECQEEPFNVYLDMLHDDYYVLDNLLYSCEHESWDDFKKELSLAAFMRMPTIKGADCGAKELVKNLRGEYKDSVKKLAEEFAASEADFKEDITDLAPKIKCLFALTMDFDKLYSEMKREKRLLDFSDLEQLALAVLSKKTADGKYLPSDIAKATADRFEYILVDECQDINKAQNTIFDMICRPGNLFFVGDVKQSIYRFRQAMPELFLKKRRTWPVFDGKNYPATIILGKNYRSRKSIAGAVNFIFEQIMSTEAAEMDYGPEEMLIPEAAFPDDGICRNEALLIRAGDDSVKAEAAATAERIYNMVIGGMPVSDGENTRPVRYSDICILLRSMKNQSDAYVSALRAKGINCRSERAGGFLDRPEIAAVADVLKAVDNPLLDIPLAGAMLSEMFMFTPEELAKMRVDNRKVPLYSSVKAAAENGNEKAADFIKTMETLRRTASYERSDKVIEQLYDITAFPQIMRSLEDGALRLANLRLLIKYAADREEAGSHGLSAFVRFLNRIEERESDLVPAGNTDSGGNCVRIMSVHGSKGLEFPVVFLCGTGKKFNFENRTDIPFMHPELGFACARRDPVTGARFATVPQQALKHELHRLAVAEEMRILYVALTRAKENLVITCCKNNPEKYLASLAADAIRGKRLDPFAVAGASCEADWIFTCLLRHPEAKIFRNAAGLNENCVLLDETPWHCDIISSEEAAAEETAEEKTVLAEADEKLLHELEENEKWVYPFASSEKIPVKAGVSSLTHQKMHEEMLFSAKPSHGRLSGAERGTALHTFMQFCDFNLAKADPYKEVSRLAKKRFITEKQAEVIDCGKVAAFFESGLYRRMEKADKIWRELRFLQGISAAELGYEDAFEDDKITVQGVADCVFEEDGKLIVVDYKTDFVENIEELRERYAAQLNMYKKLLSQSMGKEVVSAIIWSFRFGKELEV